MSDLSLFQHWSTLNAIDRVGDRMHAGLMSLATAQAGAMKKLGTQIEGGLFRIDQSIMEQSQQLSRIDGALGGLRQDMSRGFIAISDQMSGLERRLDQIEEKVSKPEETRAWERFNRAATLLKKGYPADALENLKAAIENDGGLAFRHIPEFHLLLGQILIGDTKPRNPDLVDYDAAHCAFRQASLHLDGKKEAVALCRAGAAAFLDGDDDTAIDTYLDALKIPHDYQYTHFEIAKCYLNKKDGKRAEHHLCQAVDLDWSMVALVATDPFYQRNAAWATSLVESYRNFVVNKISPTVPALQHLATGPTKRNMMKMRERIREVARGIDLSSLDRDLELNHQPSPSFGIYEYHYSQEYYDESKSYDYTEASRLNMQESLEALSRQDIGLLDINEILNRNNLVEALKGCINFTKTSNETLGNDLRYFQNKSEPRQGKRSRYFATEATKKAKRRAKLDGDRPQGVLARVIGLKPVRSSQDLRELSISENERFSAVLADAMQSDVERYLKVWQRTEEIIEKAEEGLSFLQLCRDGNVKFVRGAPVAALNTEVPAPG